jgi:prepilin peptidase CpaA
MLTSSVLLLIAFYDYLRHRIPNLFLILLVLSILIGGNISVELTYGIAVSALAIFGYLRFGLGAGDVKLLFIISIFLTPVDQIAEYWSLFSIMATGLILLKWISAQSLKGNIALAPALCGAVLCISSLNHI